MTVSTMSLAEEPPAISFKDCTSDELHHRLQPLGVSERLARRLQSAVLRGQRGEFPTALAEVSPALLERVRRATHLPRLTMRDKVVSPRDGFAKYLFSGSDDQLFEAVRIPLLHRPDDPKYVVCVSSQVGCALACAFCATGRLGFRRNLAAWEMVDQVLQVRDDSPHPVRGVVFMGMGEPLLNYDRVMQAAHILTESCGPAIAAKAITVSTVGIVPGIRRFIADRQPYRLIVSLTSVDPLRRPQLLPIDQTYPLDELMRAIRQYHAASGQRITLAWTMISGVNTRREDAQQLAALVAGLPVKIDLIDVNDATGRFQPPSAEELSAFRDALSQELGMPVARRYSGGQDIHGACGMLAGIIGAQQ
ncbi:MAG: 23S rRNA (adenine(2503)-C(2))-methyltransferase RlmN [Pirellulales bacterium]